MRRLLPLLALAAAQASAQCVMCFRTAEAQNAARAHFLNMGILLLGAPPFLILGGFCYLCYRRSRSYAEYPAAAEECLIGEAPPSDRSR